MEHPGRPLTDDEKLQLAEDVVGPAAREAARSIYTAQSVFPGPAGETKRAEISRTCNEFLRSAVKTGLEVGGVTDADSIVFYVAAAEYLCEVEYARLAELAAPGSGVVQ